MYKLNQLPYTTGLNFFHQIILTLKSKLEANCIFQLFLQFFSWTWSSDLLTSHFSVRQDYANSMIFIVRSSLNPVLNTGVPKQIIYNMVVLLLCYGPNYYVASALQIYF